MKWLRNLKVGAKIVSLVILMALFLAGVGFTGYYYNKQSNANINTLYINKLTSISWIKEARADNRNAQLDTLKLFLAPLSKDEEQITLNDLNDRINRYDNDMTNYYKTNPESYELQKIATFKTELPQFRDERTKALQMASNGDKAGGYQYYLEKAVPHMDITNTILADLSKYNDNTAKTTYGCNQ